MGPFGRDARNVVLFVRPALGRSRTIAAAVGALLAACAAGCGDDGSATVDGDTSSTIDAGITPSGVDEAGTSPPDNDDAGADDASTPVNTNPDALPATVGSWTWFDFPDSTCANGEPTGIGVNLGTSRQVLIYLEGGGACWNEATCYTIGTGSNVKTGYKKEDFDSRFQGESHGDKFDRTAEGNPFKDMSFVYVPYCTGDVHSGDATQKYGSHVTHHAGRTNLEAFLKRVVPTFEDATRVILAGSSAGGFGALVNYWRVQKEFGSVRVDLVDDSGPPFDQKYIKNFGAWKKAWNLGPAMAPGCVACQANVNAVLPYYAAAYHASRFALLSYNHDPTISIFFGIIPGQFAGGLGELTSKQIEPSTNVKYFVVDGYEHTMLGNLSTTSQNVQLGAWLTDMVSDNPEWASVKLD